MRNIVIADTTLAGGISAKETAFSFREKTEIARCLDRMCADVIEFSPIVHEKTDALLVRAISPIMKNSTLSQRTGYTVESVDLAWTALVNAANPRLSVSFPVAAAQMEFVCHMKPSAVLHAIPDVIARAKSYTENVEFRAVDATRAEYAFLTQAIEAAIAAGATTVTVCDNASMMTPEEFSAFLTRLKESIPALDNVRLGVECTNGIGMALACAVSAVNVGVSEIKCACVGDLLPSEEQINAFIRSRGDSMGVRTGLKSAEISRITAQVNWLTSGKKGNTATEYSHAASADNSPELVHGSSQQEVSAAIAQLGYDLTEEDIAKVYEAFTAIAEKKPVSTRELDVIVATTALQVPPTYKLVSYVINNGNIMPATAQIHLEKDGTELHGVYIGDGPIDAAFLAIEQIIGHHYELDEFRIQAVTEGREAMGSALVRLRSNGKLYSGNGISTDIIGAGIRAYLNALNKIVYEEA